MENLLSANTKSFGEIIKGEKKLIVPDYQRNYSWTSSQWEDLWNDIERIKSENSKHYMGSVVFLTHEVDKNTFNITDGQQRLTTLSIIILAIVDRLQRLIDDELDIKENIERKEMFMRDYIGTKSKKSLKFSNKLKLNEVNDPFYSTNLVNQSPVINIRKLEESNKLLYKCYQFFQEKLDNYISSDKNMDIIDKIIELEELISNDLLFIDINATNELSAYLIFETLNDRGLALSVTDLLKNFLFSKCDRDDHHHIKNIWNEILKYVPYDRFSKFLRHYWLTKNKLIQEKDLFKAIRDSVKTAENAFELLEDLKINAPIYSAISAENNNYFNGNRNLVHYVDELRLFKVTQCYPLLLSSINRFESKDIEKVFRYCSIISFRYSVIAGLNANKLEPLYNEIAIGITNGKLKNSKEVLEKLKEVYVEKETFINSFKKKTINTKSNKKLPRYILYGIENKISQRSLSYITDEGTIEHILPENPSNEWFELFPKENFENFIYRLGNFTLLEETYNRNIGNLEFNKKIAEYRLSDYHITKNFSKEDWNMKELENRQLYLGKIAEEVWKINDL